MVVGNFTSEMKKSPATIGQKVRAVLLHAVVEKRITVGLSAAVKSLSKTPDESLFCILAPPKKGDSSTHMLEVLLEAYCYENDIYIIKVDSSEKLGRILGSTYRNESCALIQKTMLKNSLDADSLTVSENELVDYCEESWDVPVKAAIVLPQ